MIYEIFPLLHGFLNFASKNPSFVFSVVFLVANMSMYTVYPVHLSILCLYVIVLLTSIEVKNYAI